MYCCLKYQTKSQETLYLRGFYVEKSDMNLKNIPEEDFGCKLIECFKKGSLVKLVWGNLNYFLLGTLL